MKATLRKFIAGVVIAAYCVVALAQDPHSEGVAAGNAANAADPWHGESADRDRVCCRPAITTRIRPRRRFTAQPSLSGATAARIAYCNSPAAVNDITCQAIRTAIGSASTPRPPVSPTDASVLVANSAANNPGAQGVTLSGVYSACTTQTQLLVARGVRHAKLQQLLPAQHRQSVSEDAHRPSHLGLCLPRRDDQRPDAGGGLDRTAAR